MRKYEVTAPGYVPVGTGFKYKVPGQVVTLDDDDAADVAELIKPVKGPGGVAKRNTQSKTEAKPGAARLQAKPDNGEVTSDAGEPTPAVQRAGTEAVE